MAIRRGEEQAARFVGMSQYTAAPTPTAGPTDRLRNAVRVLREQAVEREEAEAMRRAAVAGAQQQSALGDPAQIARPPEYATRFQEQFAQAARAVNSQQAKLTATREAARLAREHRHDPRAFAESWEAVMQGQLRGLQESDPQAAIQNEAMLNEVGAGALLRLEEQAFNRQQDALLADFSENVRQHLVDAEDILLQGGNEEDLVVALNTLEELAAEGVENGLVEATTAQQVVARERDRLHQQYARGDFNRSLRNGDFAGALGLIEGLERGKIFDRNESGIALAAQLRAQLKAAQAPDQSFHTPSELDAMRKLERAIYDDSDAATLDELAERLDRVYASTTNPNDIRTATELFNNAALREAIHEQIRTQPVGSDGESPTGLYALERIIDEQFRGISPGRREQLVQAVRDRRDEIRDLAASRNAAAIGGELNWATASVADLRQRQENVQRVTGLARDAVPLWTRSEEAAMSQHYREAMQEGDVQGAMMALSAYMAPAESPWEQMALALRAEETSAEFSLAAIVANVMGETDAVALMKFASDGSRASLDGLDITPRDVQRVLESRNVSRAVNAATMGDGALASPLNETIRDAFVGLAAQFQVQGGDRKDAQAELERLLTPLTERETFANGSSMPSKVLAAHPAGAKAARRAIDEVLSDPRNLGFTAADTEALTMVHPTVFEGGTITFVDRSTGQTILNDQGAPLTLFPAQILAEQGLSEAPVGTFEAAQATVNDSIRNLRSARTARRIGQAAQNLGTNNAAFVEDVAFAMQMTPLEERPAMRVSTTGYLPLDIEDRVDARVIRERGIAPETQRLNPRLNEQSLVSEDLAPATMAYYLDQLVNKYGDEQTAAVAYYVGEDVLDAAMQESPDNWEALLEVNVDKFLMRMNLRSLPEQDVAPARQGFLEGPRRLGRALTSGGFIARELGLVE